ncbi:MAG: cyclic dehypoxanthinyl futalosine synthase [Nitrososphaerales archaeon]
MSLLTEMVKRSDIGDILDGVLDSRKPDINDCVRLMNSDDVQLLCLVADTLRRRKFGNTVTFVNNLIFNYTNVCVTYCKFCAFYRPPGHKETYTVSIEDGLKRVTLARDMFGITQVLMQGGHNPSLGIEYYENMFRGIKEKCPEVGIHGLSASEIDTIAKVERSSIKEVLERLKEAGLDSVPGAGAEILVDEVKEQISPLKIKSDEWLRIMEEAHKLGLKASATMMYGHVETVEQRAESLMKIIELQKKTGGFMAFIPWSFEPNNTQMKEEGMVSYSAGGLQLLKMIAISRIMLNGLIDHIQSSWLTNGIGMAQLALNCGADDFGGTLHGEEVVTATGARSTTVNAEKIINAVKQMGMQIAERDNFYGIVKYH